MLSFQFLLALATVTTTMNIDFGVIFTALAPTLAVVVTWWLQRRSTQNAAKSVAAVTVATASKVADIHKEDTAMIQQSVGEVHSLVNGKNDKLAARVAELEAENRSLKGVPARREGDQ